MQPLVATQGLMVTLYCRKGHKTHMILARSDQKASFLQSSIFGTKRILCKVPREEAIKQPYVAATSMDHSNDQHGKIHIKV